YWFGLKRLGPVLAPVGGPVATRKQIVSFYVGLAILWVGADFPLHELSEDYLFSMHMVQHTLFSLVAPPFLLMGMPAWILRKLIEPKWVWRVARVATRPVFGLVAFNVMVVVTHWPTLVNASVSSEPLHFALHLVLFSSAMCMWWPVIAPLPELARLSEPAKMIYLFLQSVVPTVPASFLTFTSTPIYSVYASFPRLWGLDPVTDLRVAGLIMKLGGGLLLWIAIAIVFFRWSAKEERQQHEEVTWEEFERELEAFDMRRT
ncbi:MAG: cytochrome c oxidase assembly protein, partial [Actinomycetota bacterium]|nr:cytochrome c oxidase assembly protein [Actinomycetota bacterium]